MGTPLAAVDGAYFEVFPLDELERTLGLLRNVLRRRHPGDRVGDRPARPRSPRPGGAPARTGRCRAEQIAGGELGTRLPDTATPTSGR